LENACAPENRAAREAPAYANTDGEFHAVFREPAVQESKHCAARRISFVKLKDMRFGIRWKLFGLLPLIACLGMACPEFSGAAPRQAGKAAPKVEENTLAHEIRHQVHVLPFYSVFDYISFTLDGHKVTLTGYVLRPHLRNDAERAIGSIEGVTSVVNAIEVLPKSSTDDDFRRAVYRAIFEDAALQRYAVADMPTIHIIVKDGAVTLEGNVENETDKRAAGARAAGVPGVSGVSNHLGVHEKEIPAN